MENLFMFYHSLNESKLKWIALFYYGAFAIVVPLFWAMANATGQLLPINVSFFFYHSHSFYHGFY